MSDTTSTEQHQDSILGLSTEEIAGLSSDELTDNPVAIRMLLHYYRQLVGENNTLKNNNNTLRTYVDAYERHRTNTAVGGVLLAISNVSVGFGVNLLTSSNTSAGVASLGTGIALVLAGCYFTFKRR